TRSATGLSSLMCSRFKDSTSCWTSHNLSRSSPVSYSPPWSAAMTLSAAGCDVPQASGDIATSRMSAPASTAAMYAIGAMPVGQGEWPPTGLFTLALSAPTSPHADLYARPAGRGPLPRPLRAQQARRVLDHYFVAAHVGQALCDRDPQLD